MPLPPRLVVVHLGNGASLCAIREGLLVAATTGYSTLDGLVMGTGRVLTIPASSSQL